MGRLDSFLMMEFISLLIFKTEKSMETKNVFMQMETNVENTVHKMVNDKEKELNIMKMAKKNLNAIIKMIIKKENKSDFMKVET